MSDHSTSMDISPTDTPLPASSPPVEASSAAVTSPPADTTTSDTNGKDTLPSSPTPAKATPKKRGAKAKKEDSDEEDEGTPKKKAKSTPKAALPKTGTPKRKTPAKAVAGARPIARSYDECSESDKKLIDMRDAGKVWTEIRAEWEKLTGDKTGSSTLPNRYSRLKSNFIVIKDEDNARILEAKNEVEEEYEKNKWTMIAAMVEKLGGDKYKPDALQRQYKKLMLQADTAPPAGVKDKDFDVKVDDEE